MEKERTKEVKKTVSKEIKKAFSNSKNILKIQQSWKVLIILSFLATMAMYAETMLIPAIPILINDFKVSYGLSSWILTSYLVAGAVMTPIAGKLSDIYGRKKILLIIMVIYTIGVSIGGFANNFNIMLIARTIQGIGLGMFPIAFSIIRDQFPREKISITTGIITSMFAAGSVIGLSIGGLIIHEFGWKTTFYTIIPISLVLLFMIRKYIHISDGHPTSGKSTTVLDKSDNLLKNDKNQTLKKDEKINTQIDIKGSVLLAITIISFLLSLTLLQSSNDSNNNNNLNIDNKFANFNSSLERVFPFIMIGIISLFFFIYVERRSKHPLIDFKIFLNPPILLSNLMLCRITSFNAYLISSYSQCHVIVLSVNIL